MNHFVEQESAVYADVLRAELKVRSAALETRLAAAGTITAVPHGAIGRV